ncbi:hypothetical protein IV203_019556 [Nitzschia inconspicua]|uniref:Uncharacterized protein n=1 Tax=Nitzschia inconspicua TaxID=303405 RepID=A0A9K3M157_9STRA|nr:hypothetical protein IV203_019556 [Nitzschia inconspicua]
MLDAAATVEGHHAKLDFHFWIKRGYTFFRIVNEHHCENVMKTIDLTDSETGISVLPQLDFTVALQILEEDDIEPINHKKNARRYTRDSCRPLKILMERNSSRWWSIKHHLSNAVDANEGRPFVIADS